MASRDYSYVPPEPREPKQPIPIRPGRRSRSGQIFAWIAGGLGLLLVLLVVATVLVMRSARFHDYVLRTLQAKASESLGTPVHLQNFNLRLATLNLDLYGLTVEGQGPGAGQPLLQADHGNLHITVTSFLHRAWYIDNVAIDHPVVKLIVNKNGDTNLPTPPKSNSSSKTDTFDLGIRHLMLSNGAIYYNDAKTPLDADLHDLHLQSTYDTTDGGRYYGNLGYNDGHLKYGAYAPITHALQAQFDARRAGMKLSNVTLTTPPLIAKLDASIQNYSSPVVHGSYAITLDGGELRRILQNPSLPIGQVMVHGTADYASDPKKPVLNTVVLDGQVSGRELLLRSPQINTTIRNLGGHFHVADGNADISDLRANLLGGELTSNATVHDLSGKGEGHAVAEVKNISLADLKSLANTASLKQVSIRGTLNATADARWSGSMQNLLARADATVSSNVAQTGATANALPVDALIHATYDGAQQTLGLKQSYIRTPQTTADFDGTVSSRSALQVRLQANNLHEFETIADRFSAPPKPGQPAQQPLGLGGTASFNGTITGSTSAPDIAGHLNANNIQVRGSAFKSLRTDVAANPSFVRLANGNLQPAEHGDVAFNIQSALKDWSYTPESPVVANIKASQLSVAELAKAAGANAPISGTLNASIDVHGTQTHPIGQGRVSLMNADISGQPVQSANVDFTGTGDVVDANLLVKTAAGNATGKLAYYPGNQGYDAALQATNIQLAKLQAVADRDLGIAGTLNLTASGRGTFNDPQGQMSLTIPQLAVKDQQIRDVNLRANVAHHEADFNLESQVVNTPLRAQGKIALTGDYYADARLDTPVIALQPLIATYAPDQAADMTGETEIHATLRGPLKKKELLEAHLNIPKLDLKYQQVQIGAVKPIVADYLNGVLTVQPGQIKGTGTDIRFQGRVPLTTERPAAITLLGNVDLAVAHLLDPDVDSSGQLQFDVNAAGNTANQAVQGQIKIVNANFSTADAPVGLSEANGVLTLRSNRVDITQFAGKIGGGTVTATGGVVYRPALQFNVALKGKGVRLLYPQGLRTDLDANLAMAGTAENSALTGQININRVTFTPDFDLTTFANQFSGESSPAPSGGIEDKLKLNIAVRTTNELNAYSRTTSIQGDANLRVIGTAADPVIVGRTNLTGGELFLLGNRYLVQGGPIAFVNTTRTEPILNLQVNTTIQQYNIAMRFQGPLDRLHTNYTSDPALPPADIINLLAFGKTQEAQAAQAQPGNLGAESVLASGVTSQVTGRLEKIAGISHLSVDPVLAGGGNQNPGARVTIQQRVTSKLYVTFATDVTQTQTQEIQLEYHVNRKWSVSGDRDQNGGFGVDGRYHKDF